MVEKIRGTMPLGQIMKATEERHEAQDQAQEAEKKAREAKEKAREAKQKARDAEEKSRKLQDESRRGEKRERELRDRLQEAENREAAAVRSAALLGKKLKDVTKAATTVAKKAGSAAAASTTIAKKAGSAAAASTAVAEKKSTAAEVINADTKSRPPVPLYVPAVKQELKEEAKPSLGAPVGLSGLPKTKFNQVCQKEWHPHSSVKDVQAALAHPTIALGWKRANFDHTTSKAGLVMSLTCQCGEAIWDESHLVTLQHIVWFIRLSQSGQSVMAEVRHEEMTPELIRKHLVASIRATAERVIRRAESRKAQARDSVRLMIEQQITKFEQHLKPTQLRDQLEELLQLFFDIMSKHVSQEEKAQQQLRNALLNMFPTKF